MPVRKDETGRRWVEMEILTPGTPEQVWEAFATGPGYTAWFTKAAIDGKVGGSFRLDFGQGMSTAGEVTFWEPPHRFGYVEHGWAPGAPPCATEITITARSGDRCVVRMVHSLFASGDDWDDQLEGFESGWPGFFAVLRTYLAHFAGQAPASFFAMAPASGDLVSTWARLLAALGLAGVNVGERQAAGRAPEPLSGTVDLIWQEAAKRGVLLRLDGPAPGIALVGAFEKGGMTMVSLCRYDYGDGAAARIAECEPKWREWLGGGFAAGR